MILLRQPADPQPPVPIVKAVSPLRQIIEDSLQLSGRFHRGLTLETQGISVPHNRFDRRDLGYFHPFYDDPEKEGVVYKNKDIFYTDITRFSRHLKTYSQNTEEPTAIEHQILSIWPSLLRGSSRTWWEDILSPQNQADYLKSG